MRVSMRSAMRARPEQRPDAGVTLLEMLAALAIVAVMAAAVVVMGDFGDSAEQEAGERLTRALAEAQREALMAGAFVGFSADPDGRGYRFFRHGGEDWVERRDHPALEPVRFSDPGLTLLLVEGGVARRSRDGLRITDDRDAGADGDGEGDGPDPIAPEIWFDPAGFDEPFAYRLQGPDGAARVTRGDDGALLFQPEDRETAP